MFKKTYVGLKSETSISDGNGGEVRVPIFTIFISPSELVKLAEVPSFKVSDHHSRIATNLQSPPTKDWQRPLNQDRVNHIGDYYGTRTEKRLMPNPILLGESSASSNPQNNTASIQVKQMLDSHGNAIVDVWEIEISNNGVSPLWILDGQHRTFGLESNRNTRDQRIPVVLLIKHTEYTMQFLAQIFTEVTTGATDLEEIHKNWMEYSFGMNKFKRGLGDGAESPYDKAMVAVLHLATIGSLDGNTNLFFDHIKFNPYDTTVLGAYNLNWTSKEWVENIADHYYKNTGGLPSLELAEQILRFLRAAESLDQYKNSGSKLFGEKPFQVLLNHFVWQFLENLDEIGKKSQHDWEQHLKYHDFDKADWRLLWATGSQSSVWGRYTNRAAQYVWQRIMSNQKFAVTPDIALRGPAVITLTAYAKTASGKKSRSNMASQETPSGALNINGGADRWTTGVNRTLIEFTVPQNGIGSIQALNYKDAKGQTGSIDIKRQDSSTELFDLEKLSSPVDFELWTCCFNEASKKKDNFTIQW